MNSSNTGEALKQSILYSEIREIYRLIIEIVYIRSSK